MAFRDKVTARHKGNSTLIKMSKINRRKIRYNSENFDKIRVFYLLVREIGPANNTTRLSGLSEHRLPHPQHPSQLAIRHNNRQWPTMVH